MTSATQNGFITALAALPLAWAIDLAFGEPRSALHPVAWLGRLIAPIGERLRDAPAAFAFVGGALVWIALAAALGWGAAWLQAQLLRMSPWLGVPLLALLLKPTFAWRMLRDEVAAVERALQSGLASGRAQLARIVSRDVSALDADAIRETAIESLAENLNDSLVAPLFWYALAGLPGAVVYRFANTLDAMWAYRGRWEWAGKWSARADDVLSWLPARLTAALLMPWRLAAWRALTAEARRTPSPNGGWPMGAVALRLGVRLRKPGVYALNEGAPSPHSADTARALQLATRAAWLGVGGAALLIWVRLG
ncbi:MAG: adenosylcobinamide-phosphate synthase CbiB [Burkholderiales bacterium]